MPKGYSPFGSFMTGLTQGAQTALLTTKSFMEMQEAARKIRELEELSPLKKRAAELETIKYGTEIEKLQAEIARAKTQTALEEAKLREIDQYLKDLDRPIPLESLRSAFVDESAYQDAVSTFRSFIRTDPQTGQQYLTVKDIMAIKTMFETFDPVAIGYATRNLTRRIGLVRAELDNVEANIREIEAKLIPSNAIKLSPKKREELSRQLMEYNTYKQYLTNQLTGMMSTLAGINTEVYRSMVQPQMKEREMETKIEMLKMKLDQEMEKLQNKVGKKVSKSADYFDENTGEVVRIITFEDGETRTIRIKEKNLRPASEKKSELEKWITPRTKQEESRTPRIKVYTPED